MRINDKSNDTVVKPLASFPLEMLLPSKPISKHPSKSTTKLFINDLFYSMMLILQVMMKNKFIREFQNPIQMFLLITNYTKKLSPLYMNQSPLQNQNPPQQKIHKYNHNLLHTVHKSSPFMVHPSSNTIFFQVFFLPNDYSLDLETLQQQQSQDPVLRTIYSWLTPNKKPECLTPLITGTPFLHAYYKRFSQFLKTILQTLLASTPNISFLLKHSPNSLLNTVQSGFTICLPFRLFKTAFKNYMNSPTLVLKSPRILFLNTIIYLILKKGYTVSNMFALNVNAINTLNMKIQTAPTQSFSEHAPSFSYRISMDTRGPIHPPSLQISYIHIIIDGFSQFVVTVPIKSNNAKTARKHHFTSLDYKFWHTNLPCY